MTAGQQLGSLLMEMGFIDDAQLKSALDEQTRTNKRLGKILVTAGIITEQRLVHALSRQLGIEACDPIMTPVHQRVLALVPPSLAFRYHVLPVARRREDTGDCLYVATSDPLDKAAMQALRAVLGPATRVRWMLAGETEMELALARHYGAPPSDTASAAATADVPVIQGRPVSAPRPRGSEPPPTGPSSVTGDIYSALQNAVNSTPIPAPEVPLVVGSRPGEVAPSQNVPASDILLVDDVVEDEPRSAAEAIQHAEADGELDLDAAIANALSPAPEAPIADLATPDTGLPMSSPLADPEPEEAPPPEELLDSAFEPPMEALLDSAFEPPVEALPDSAFELDAAEETYRPPPITLEPVSDSVPETAFDPEPEPERPLDPEPVPEPRAEVPKMEPPPAASAQDDVPTAIPQPTVPEPAEQELAPSGPSWGDLLDQQPSDWDQQLSIAPLASPSDTPAAEDVVEPPEAMEPPEPVEPPADEAPTLMESKRERSAAITISDRPVPRSANGEAHEEAEARAPEEAAAAVALDAAMSGEGESVAEARSDAPPTSTPPEATPDEDAVEARGDAVAEDDAPNGADPSEPTIPSDASDQAGIDANETPLVMLESEEERGFAERGAEDDVSISSPTLDVLEPETPRDSSVRLADTVEAKDDDTVTISDRPRDGNGAAPEPVSLAIPPTEDKSLTPLPSAADILARESSEDIDPTIDNATPALDVDPLFPETGAAPEPETVPEADREAVDDLPDASEDIQLADEPSMLPDPIELPDPEDMTPVDVRDAVLRFIKGEPLEPDTVAFLVRVITGVMLTEGLLDDDRLQSVLDKMKK